MWRFFLRKQILLFWVFSLAGWTWSFNLEANSLTLCNCYCLLITWYSFVRWKTRSGFIDKNTNKLFIYIKSIIQTLDKVFGVLPRFVARVLTSFRAKWFPWLFIKSCWSESPMRHTSQQQRFWSRTTITLFCNPGLTPIMWSWSKYR